MVFNKTDNYHSLIVSQNKVCIGNSPLHKYKSICQISGRDWVDENTLFLKHGFIQSFQRYCIIEKVALSFVIFIDRHTLFTIKTKRDIYEVKHIEMHFQLTYRIERQYRMAVLIGDAYLNSWICKTHTVRLMWVVVH